MQHDFDITLMLYMGMLSHLRGESPQERLTLIRGKVELLEALPVALRAEQTTHTSREIHWSLKGLVKRT